MKDLSEILKRPEYGFIRTNEHLGDRVILLGLAGSYAYGTNVEGSDIDVRGIALNRKSDLLGLTRFEQYEDDATDTVIFAFNKIVELFLACNPNTIELLGLRPEHYLYLNASGRMLIENRRLFLSKRAIQSFGGYAGAQLRRLQNALARDSFPQAEKERHILNSVTSAMRDFNGKYQSFESGMLRVYIDKAENPKLETEIFADVELKHYPLRDYLGMWKSMSNVIKEYDKFGKRNKKKDDLHLNKHAMHLVRLFLMAFDILEKGEINTCRTKEHDLLMDIRLGKFRKEDGSFDQSFYDLISSLEKRLSYAAEHTVLPDEPDLGKVQDLVMALNEQAVRDDACGLRRLLLGRFIWEWEPGRFKHE